MPPPMPPMPPPMPSMLSPASGIRLPKVPRSAIAGSLDFVRFCETRSRLDSAFGWCIRRHFQKKARISSTFEPPEMYSTALS